MNYHKKWLKKNLSIRYYISLLIQLLHKTRRQYHQDEINMSKYVVSASRIFMRNTLHKDLDDGKMSVKVRGRF